MIFKERYFPFLKSNKKCFLSLINLKNIPEMELRKQYIDYIFTHLEDGFGSPFSKIAEDMVYSSAKKTENADKVVFELSIKYGLNKQWQILKKVAENDIPIIMAIADINQNCQLIETDLSTAGYFLGFSRKETVNGMKWRIMQFEPLYQEDKTDLLRQYKVAYHWSPSYNKGNILKNGFIPSSSNKMFSYPPRIYFMNGQSTDKELLSIVQGLCCMNIDERNNNIYTLFFIDTSEIPENVKFYLDPNMKNSLYTNNSIPNSVIFKTKDYKIF